ncbi:MAG: hypothetical protein WBB74_10690 [Gaiellaceae bacterium]
MRTRPQTRPTPSRRSRYAERTGIDQRQSRMELERILRRHGASELAFREDETSAVVRFSLTGLYVEFVLPLPDRHSAEFRRTSTGLLRTPEAQERAYEQAVRQQWRALILVARGKLQAVDCGISTIDAEFSSRAPGVEVEEVSSNGASLRRFVVGRSRAVAMVLGAAALVPASSLAALSVPSGTVERLVSPLSGAQPAVFAAADDPSAPVKTTTTDRLALAQAANGETARSLSVSNNSYQISSTKTSGDAHSLDAGAGGAPSSGAATPGPPTTAAAAAAPTPAGGTSGAAVQTQPAAGQPVSNSDGAPVAPSKSDPAPSAGNSAPKPDSGKPAPKPDTGNPAPTPDTGKPAPKPDTGKPAPKPDSGKPAPKPDTGNPAPTPDSGKPAPKPNNGNPAPAPDNGKPAPKPDSGKPAPKPDSANPAPAPDSGKPAPKPDVGKPAPTPDTGNPASKPDSGKPDSKPNSGAKGDTGSGAAQPQPAGKPNQAPGSPHGKSDSAPHK